MVIKYFFFQPSVCKLLNVYLFNIKKGQKLKCQAIRSDWEPFKVGR